MAFFGVVVGIRLGALQALAVGPGWLLQLGAMGHGLLGDGHRPGLFLQGWGEAIAIDQHQLGSFELLALLGREVELVGVVAGLEQAGHLEVAAGESLAEVAKHPIGGHHFWTPAGATSHQGQGRPQGCQGQGGLGETPQRGVEHGIHHWEAGAAAGKPAGLASK